jgi:ethanolamine utilization protein EutA (predicted chaperonin)
MTSLGSDSGTSTSEIIFSQLLRKRNEKMMTNIFEIVFFMA